MDRLKFCERHLIGDVIRKVLFYCLVFQVPSANSSTTFCSSTTFLIFSSCYNFNEKGWKYQSLYFNYHSHALAFHHQASHYELICHESVTAKQIVSQHSTDLVKTEASTGDTIKDFIVVCLLAEALSGPLHRRELWWSEAFLQEGGVRKCMLHYA